jgi:hypothetical protein
VTPITIALSLQRTAPAGCEMRWSKAAFRRRAISTIGPTLPRSGRVYREGSHYQRMKVLIERLIDGPKPDCPEC